MAQRISKDANDEQVLIASAVYTSLTSCAPQVNKDCGGVEFLLNITANPGGTETLTIDLLWKDPVSGTNYIIDRSRPFLAANEAVRWTPSVPLPRTWLASVQPSASGNWTFSLSAARTPVQGVGLRSLPSGQPWSYSNQSSSAQTDTEIKAAVSGLRHYVKTLYVAANGAVTITLEQGTATFKWRYYAAAAGDGATVTFDPPLEMEANTSLTYTTSGAVEHTIVTTGVTGP